jgi:chromate reductase, NAD(P)H dehydrogenase (quinone)
MQLLDHISITVRDLERAKPFYRTVMASLGAALVYEQDDAIGFGQRNSALDDRHSYLSVLRSEQASPDPRRHCCLRAASARQVRDFHAAGLAAGGICAGEPGLRSYHPHYFAAFLLDPEGNKIEAVCHQGEAVIGHSDSVYSVLALSGSLRSASINSALLRVAAGVAPQEMRVRVYDRLGQLPLFNLDLESEVPPAVAAFRDAVAACDALLIASPEYAHGVSGVMKNALDWLVSLEAFFDKPVVLLNAQPRASFSDAALRETLQVMSAKLVMEASGPITLTADSLNEAGMLASPAVCESIQRRLGALRDFLRSTAPLA